MVAWCTLITHEPTRVFGTEQCLGSASKKFVILLANLETLKCRLAYPLFEGTQALKQPLQKPRLCGVK
jgi:hypothetical protein